MGRSFLVQALHTSMYRGKCLCDRNMGYGGEEGLILEEPVGPGVGEES